MIVNIEFFDTETIENIITCLNYQVDKVIFFGHSDTMTKDAKELTRKVLKKICNITDVVFIELSRKRFDRVVEVMETEILKETEQGSKCFFDLTGGEDIVLAAMGALSVKFVTSMHRFDIRTGQIILLNAFDAPSIEDVAKKTDIKLTLDDIIAFKGGSINYKEQKKIKCNPDDKNFQADVEKIWDIVSENPKKWNVISGILRLFAWQNNELEGLCQSKKIKEALKNAPDINGWGEFIGYLNRLGNERLLRNIRETQNEVYISFKNPKIKECLLDAGSALEFFTYYDKIGSGRYQDCRVGVHIDWDELHEGPGRDVENEIDVLCLEGYIPTFISCKNGKVNQMALYELHTVAERFGGEYAKKELAISQPLANAYKLRAQEMDITVIDYSSKKINLSQLFNM